MFWGDSWLNTHQNPKGDLKKVQNPLFPTQIPHWSEVFMVLGC